MKKYTDLIELLEKIFGKGSVSRTIGTRTNVVRFPKGKQPIDPTVSNFDVEGTAAKNPDLVQTIENSIADRMGEITKMNDQELLTYTANVRRLANFKEPPVQNADVIKFGSGEEIKGKGLEQLIEKQGTVNPPTTVAGRLETQGKKLEKAGEDLKEITKPKSVIGDIMKDYGDFDKYMQSSQKTGYVRATVRQIMREDIQAGKLKLPKELQDQVMKGIGEPIDIYRKVYGEGALEQIDSLADDLGQFRTEEEAAKFARSKYTFEPKVEPVDESMTYDELGNLIKKGTDEPEGKADGGRIGYAKGKRVKSSIDKLLENLNKKTQGKKSMESVDPKTGEVTVPKKPIRRAEEPTGMTTMDVEPEIVDERSIKKTKSIMTIDDLKTKHKDAFEAHDQIFNVDINDKIAPDMIAESMAETRGKDYFSLSQEEQSNLYKKALAYVDDVRMTKRQNKSLYVKGDAITEENFGNTPFAPSQETLDNLKKAREMTKGMSLEEEMNMVLNQYDKSMFIKNEQGMVDVTNPENVQKMALLLKKDHPELYRRLEGGAQTNVLEDFNVTGRKPNANGGLNYLMGL
jgi:hypothetical protein